MSALRRDILRKVDDLFYFKGVSTTGVDEVAATCGVAKASIYRLFGSKEELVVEWLRSRDGNYMEWLTSSVDMLSPAPTGKPLAVFDSLASRFRRSGFRGCAFLNTIVELGQTDHPAVYVARAHKVRFRKLLESYLYEAGYGNAAHLSELLAQLVDGAQIASLREHGPEPVIRAKQMATCVLEMEGIKRGLDD